MEVAELTRRLKTSDLRIQASHEIHWSDRELIEFIRSYAPPTKEDLTRIYSSFLTAYTGSFAGVESGMLLRAAIFAVPTISGREFEFATLGKKNFIFNGKDPLYSETAKVQQTKPGEPGTSTEKGVDRVTLEVLAQDSNPFDGLDAEEEEGGGMTEEEEKQVSSDFIDIMTKIMNSPQAYQAYRVLSFLAMISFRVIVRNTSAIRRYFTDIVNTRKRVSSCTGVSLRVRVPPPSREFLEDLVVHIPKGNALSSEVLSTLTAKYIRTAGSDDFLRFLEGGCLVHISGNGLGLVELVERVSRMYEITISDVLSLLLTSMSFKSVKRVMEFIGGVTQNRILSWRWSRAITDRAFREMRIQDNLTFTAFLVALAAEAMEDADIWKIRALDEMTDTTKQQAIVWARKFLRRRAVAQEEADFKASPEFKAVAATPLVGSASRKPENPFEI